MCDLQCTVGIGITVGLLGIMLTIVCCKTLCEFLLEMNKSDTEQAPTRTTPQKIIEMPIVLRIYLPQQNPITTQQTIIQPKISFEPLPV